VGFEYSPLPRAIIVYYSKIELSNLLFVGDFTFYNEWDILQLVERIFSNVQNVKSKLLNSILE
jgi:hypothetical protein